MSASLSGSAFLFVSMFEKGFLTRFPFAWGFPFSFLFEKAFLTRFPFA